MDFELVSTFACISCVLFEGGKHHKVTSRKQRKTLIIGFIRAPLSQLLAASFKGENAIRFGGMFGTFALLWKLVNNGMRVYRDKDDRLNGLVAGAVAGLAILCERQERRVDIAQQLFVRYCLVFRSIVVHRHSVHITDPIDICKQSASRSLQCRKSQRYPILQERRCAAVWSGMCTDLVCVHGRTWTKYTKEKKTISCLHVGGQMQPHTLDPGYYSFMLKTARVPSDILRINEKNVRGLPISAHETLQTIQKYKPTKHALSVVESIPAYPATVPCEVIHPWIDGCNATAVERFLKVCQSMLPVYGTLHFVPMLLLRSKTVAKK